MIQGFYRLPITIAFCLILFRFDILVFIFGVTKFLFKYPQTF